MASSSTPRSPPAHCVRSPQRDVFKPRFPIDPFASARVREQWRVNVDQIPVYPPSDVILILGVPTTQELGPLLLSKYLSNAILIIASHEPPQIPHTTLPTVRILRLKERLDIEDAGAVRFVNVLEWAERVGRVWRKHGGVGAVELLEDDDGREYVPPPTSIFTFSGTQSTPASPRSSSSRLNADLAALNDNPRPRSTLLSSLGKSTRSLLPIVDPTQRPFDALINFLPKNTPDKALLKQAILVTTISRPFLMAANGNSAPSQPRSHSSKRWSLFSSRSTSSVYLPPTPPHSASGESLNTLLPPPPLHAHLLHLLPQESRFFNASARSKFVQSLESFLISFGYPPSLDTIKNDAMERARPYLMRISHLSQTIVGPPVLPSGSPYGLESASNVHSLADLVLSGCLDGYESPSANYSSKSPLKTLTRLTPRAWISGPSDIVLLAEGATTSNVNTPNVTFTPPSPDARSSSYFHPHLMPPPRARTHNRLPLTQAAADNSFSSTLSSSPTSPSTSPVPAPTSPLANEYNAKSQLSALPTPPDSDESGSDSQGHNVHASASVSRASFIGGGGKMPFMRRRVVSAVSASDQGAMEPKGKTRWRFWRMVR